MCTHMNTVADVAIGICVILAAMFGPIILVVLVVSSGYLGWVLLVSLILFYVVATPIFEG